MIPQPMIAVRDVEESSRWYQAVLGLRSGHGGADYEQLLDGDRLVLQLHRLDADEHAHLLEHEEAPRGNGIVLWFFEDRIDAAYARAIEGGATVLEPLHVNPLAHHREFWVRDVDGYVVVVSGASGDMGADAETVHSSE